MKYWTSDPSNPTSGHNYNRWHLYHLERMAPGYFLHNLVVDASKNLHAKHDDTWFPHESKEVYLEASCPFHSDA